MLGTQAKRHSFDHVGNQLKLDSRSMLIILIYFLFCGASSSGSEVPAAKPFTVADSIRMTHLLDPHEEVPGAQAKASPDGKHFFALTERGILATNTREYTILVFSQLNPKTGSVLI